MFRILAVWASNRFRNWLVCWVFLADVLLEIATLTILNLDRPVNRAHDWAERAAWVDSGCGPFRSEGEAFASASVNFHHYRLLPMGGGWRIYVKGEESNT